METLHVIRFQEIKKITEPSFLTFTTHSRLILNSSKCPGKNYSMYRIIFIF